VTSTVVAGIALAPDVPTVRSMALRCQGLAGGKVEPMIEAVALARRAPLLVEHAGACEDAAMLLARGGWQAEATALLAEALERYEQAGADAWAGRVRAQLRAFGVRPGPRGPRHRTTRGWESLSAKERAVSLLVAEGLTNGAVARRLYISPHTVNTHLRHVSPSSPYRTGLRSPPWCITRSSDVFAVGGRHNRSRAANACCNHNKGVRTWTTERRCGIPTSGSTRETSPGSAHW
jgi:hypothetical protein